MRPMSANDRDDPDRQAILARRRRFIAIALGGITTGCGRPKPENTSSTTGATSGVESSESASTSGPESGSETAPAACLKFDLPREQLDLPPEPETGSDESDSGTDSGTTGPPPCLAGVLPNR